MLLRGLGTAFALPYLEAMLPRARAEDATGKPPIRVLFLSVPNGKHMADWKPRSFGTDFEMQPILEPIRRFKSEENLISGLTLNGGRAQGDGPGDHARSCASFLTGAHPRKTHGRDIRNGILVDQLAAQKIGDRTRFASLELGIEQGAQAGDCDSGYSCAYSSHIAWRTPTSPVAKEVDPRAVFDRLFSRGRRHDREIAAQRRLQNRQSVLDFVLEDARQLQRQLAAADLRKLDEYLFAVRQIELRLVADDKLPNRESGGNYSRPVGVPEDCQQHVHLQFDVMALALQTDSTRIATFMFANEGSNRTYPQIGVTDGHHQLSHHDNQEQNTERISKINRYHVSQLGYLLGRLSDMQEGGGTLLDNCMLMYGSGLSDGNRHNHDDLPIAVFGRGGGALRTGQHIRCSPEAPLTNLYLSMLNVAGVSVDSFSDSTGLLQEILN